MPLTVSGVRVSFKPRGGWKDQQALLAECQVPRLLVHQPLHADARELAFGLAQQALLFGAIEPQHRRDDALDPAAVTTERHVL